MAAKAKSKQQLSRRTVKLDAQLHKRLKEYAAKTGRLLDFVTDRAIESYLNAASSMSVEEAAGQ